MSSNAYPPTAATGGRKCPVCGHATYSRSGIHPQCAVAQADRPRQEQLIEDRKTKAATPKTKVEKRKSWTKRCPKCNADVHVRIKVCKCGNEF